MLDMCSTNDIIMIILKFGGIYILSIDIKTKVKLGIQFKVNQNKLYINKF